MNGDKAGPSEDAGNDRPELDRMAIDVDAAMQVIGLRSKAGISLEEENETYIDLRDANLRGMFWGGLREASLRRANLAFADLSGASFRGDTDLSWTFCVRTQLIGADLSGADLSFAQLAGADLTDAHLIQTNLHNTNLNGTNLSRANLRGARGLTQAQLDQAYANPASPPELEGVDPTTGEPLVWSGFQSEE